MKILVIDDEAELTKSIAKYLEDEDYNCEIAPDYITATRKTDVREYDCILLDITLPGGNGLNLLKELRASRVQNFNRFSFYFQHL